MSRIITDLSSEFARTGRTRTRFFTPEIAHAMRLARKHDMRMADGLVLQRPARAAFHFGPVADHACVDRQGSLHNVRRPNMAGYFLRPGKKIRIRLFGKITTAVTPGNGSFDIYWGSGADANGTILASSAALALTASQTNLSWELEIAFAASPKARGRSPLPRNLECKRRRSRVDASACNDPGFGQR
jgi:hypothetical protein